jgi:hypothetical protein
MAYFGIDLYKKQSQFCHIFFLCAISGMISPGDRG